MSAQSWSSPARSAVHNLLVDAYSMQHPEEYGKSAKSYIAHLTALGCGVEHAADPKKYWAIPRWLDDQATIENPALIAGRGTLTIADVAHVGPAEDPERVRAWAHGAWATYANQHALARQCLEFALRSSR